MSTFLELQDETIAHGFDATSYRTRIKGWINEGQKQTARRAELRTQEQTQAITTTPNVATSALPSDFLRLRWVKDVTNAVLLSAIDLRDLDESQVATGQPMWYALSGTALTFYPTPSRAYSLQARYYAVPTTLSADGDVPSINADYHPLLVTYALSRAFRAEDDYEAANFFYAEFERDLAKLQSDLQYEDRGHKEQILGMLGP